MQAETQIKDGRADFDFLIGEWKVKHQRLRERMTGCIEWDEFEGHSSGIRKTLNGVGHFEEATMYRETGTVLGYTVRLFNPTSQEWSIYWADSVHASSLTNPQIGKFDGDRGEFYAHEPHNGKYIFSRFIWTINSEDSARWEQAFSADGGRTWETNWIMDFERV